MALNLLKSAGDPCRTLWVFRYYDLDDRRFETYGKALVRLISFLRDLASFKSRDAAKPKVNIRPIRWAACCAGSHSGYLPRTEAAGGDHINKVVTLGTPHQGISFQLQDWLKVDAEQELEHFNPAFQRDEQKENRKESTRTRRTRRFVYFKDHFPLDPLLTVVGTNYRTYSGGVSSWMNRLFAVTGEGGPAYNRSDGLVKQAFAQIPELTGRSSTNATEETIRSLRAERPTKSQRLLRERARPSSTRGGQSRTWR